jgi:hypothetical protein
MVNAMAVGIYSNLDEQDETASVLHTKVRFYLEELRHNHWIERGDPRVWPPSLPNLVPTDYFSRKFVKCNVYVSTLPVIPEEFRIRITEARAISDHDIVQKCDRRLNVGLTLPESLLTLALNSVIF